MGKKLLEEIEQALKLEIRSGKKNAPVIKQLWEMRKDLLQERAGAAEEKKPTESKGSSKPERLAENTIKY